MVAPVHCGGGEGMGGDDDEKRRAFKEGIGCSPDCERPTVLFTDRGKAAVRGRVAWNELIRRFAEANATALGMTFEAYRDATPRPVVLHCVNVRRSFPLAPLALDVDLKAPAGVDRDAIAVALVDAIFDTVQALVGEARAIALRAPDAGAKVGLHVHWPHLLVDVATALWIRAALISELATDELADLDWETIIDAAPLTGAAPLRVAGAPKRADMERPYLFFRQAGADTDAMPSPRTLVRSSMPWHVTDDRDWPTRTVSVTRDFIAERWVDDPEEATRLTDILDAVSSGHEARAAAARAAGGGSSAFAATWTGPMAVLRDAVAGEAGWNHPKLTGRLTRFTGNDSVVFMGTASRRCPTLPAGRRQHSRSTLFIEATPEGLYLRCWCSKPGRPCADLRDGRPWPPGVTFNDVLDATGGRTGQAKRSRADMEADG